MKLAFDFDNVIVDSHGTNIAYINAEFGTSHNPRTTTTSFYSDLVGLPRAEEERLLLAATDRHPLVSRPPLPGAVSNLQELSNNHTIGIVTARPQVSFDEMVEYFAMYAIPHQDIICTDSLYDGHDKKARACESHGFEVLTDDQLHYLHHCESLRLAILFAQPWNTYLDIPGFVTQASGWGDVNSIISALD